MSLDFMLAAVGLALILEGFLPFASPKRWREAMAAIATMRDGQIRFMGLLAVALGLLLLLV